MRKFVYSLMTDKTRNPLTAPLKFILWLCSLIYASAVWALAKGYEKNFFTSYKADPKVISIGNITVGGTGKTQAAIMVAKALEARRRRVAVLIRGYGADECRMLQEELSDVPILVGPDRVKSSKRAFYDFGSDTAILDDGFQHHKIGRDLDIVLLDATNPFGNGQLLPRGILREPLKALKRADVIIITKVDFKGAALGGIYAELAKLGKDKDALEAVYEPLGFRNIYDETRLLGPDMISGKKICLVSSIANPAYFRQNIINLGGQIELEFAFMDHYEYKERDFKKIDRECSFLGVDFTVVTKKDAVKIKRLASAGSLCVPILVFDVDFKIIKNKQVLDDRLSGLYTGKVL
ncbi:MAG: tetraacyldisaccharide 4'-kinase [Candidatus Omnitrophica bacterium]|nr:tetraacyldisaccharide 4'-kinase [Candidatus Omnitrophota bacterium]